ncbi:MAG: Gfo/Idh/MocA family oxidoreductase [Pirellulaceae bacterium]
MIRVGIAGVGFMGWMHYLAYRERDDIQVTALCTRNQAKLDGDWTSIQGNFGPPGEQVDTSAMSKYQEVEALLANPELDVIDVCLPPHLHKSVCLAALEAGKHVFCEKPLALNAEDCDALVAAAEGAGLQLLVGHVLPFMPEFEFLYKAVQQGTYGKLLGGRFERVISDPLWLKDFYDMEKVGGPLIDLHVHDAHLIRLLFGMPTRVTSQGRLRDDTVEYCNTLFHFEDSSLVVSATSGVLNQQGRPFMHGFEVHFEEATVQFQFAGYLDEPETNQLKVLMPGEKGQVIRPNVGEWDPVKSFSEEISEVVQSVQTGIASPLLSGQLARDAVMICQRQTDSVRSGESVTI